MSDADEGLWERGWEGHARAQRARLAALSLPDKIAWLEDAQALIDHLTRRSPAATDEAADRDRASPPDSK